MIEIEYTNEAYEDLQDIKNYISVELDNLQSAQRIVDDIVHRIDGLADFPEIGAPLISRINDKSDYRYLVCGNYNVFYRVETQTVKIVRVLSARRNFMEVLFGKDF